MTDINDIPEANALYNEQEQVQIAISHLENGGAMTTVTIQAPPQDFSSPIPSPSPFSSAAMMMTVQIMLSPPNPPELVAAMTAALKQRNAEIEQELATLGVTGTRKA